MGPFTGIRLKRSKKLKWGDIFLPSSGGKPLWGGATIGQFLSGELRNVKNYQSSSTKKGESPSRFSLIPKSRKHEIGFLSPQAWHLSWLRQGEKSDQFLILRSLLSAGWYKDALEVISLFLGLCLYWQHADAPVPPQNIMRLRKLSEPQFPHLFHDTDDIFGGHHKD